MGQMGQYEKREKVVAEYKKGGVSFREMERKCGTSASTIHRWVREHEAGKRRKRKLKDRARQALVTKDSGLPDDVKRLRKELEEARLYNQLLNAMIDIAEEQFEIPIRKKPGARQPK